tara:strand:+ start:302 stop:694 length:393 start_codon:yes stop_codon:yes gene_type:complete
MGQKIGLCLRCFSNDVPISSVSVCDPCRIASSMKKENTSNTSGSNFDGSLMLYFSFFFQVLVHFFSDRLFPFEIGGFWRGCIMGVIYYLLIEFIDKLNERGFFIKLLVRFPIQLLCWGWVLYFWGTLFFR